LQFTRGGKNRGKQKKSFQPTFWSAKKAFLTLPDLNFISKAKLNCSTDLKKLLLQINDPAKFIT
jgi:hypothetical protein